MKFKLSFKFVDISTCSTAANGTIIFKESSFNVTKGGGGGDEDIETRSLKF